MIDYSSFKVEDFLLDDRFIDSCKNGDYNEFRTSLMKVDLRIESELNKAEELLKILSLQASVEEKKTELHRLKSNLNAVHNRDEEIEIIKSKTNFYRIKNFVAAAIVLGIIAAGAIVYKSFFYTHSTGREYSLKQFNTVIASPSDDRKEITLPDGSTVLLNYGSSVRLEDKYNEKDRRLFLEGEAFFTVAPDTKRPFTVITNHSQTTAFGTSFKVKDGAGEDAATIMLATGKVKVFADAETRDQAEFILHPGMQLTVSKRGHPVQVTFLPEQLTDWKNLQISFEAADLSTIIRKLEFNYGVRFVLKNAPRKPVALTGNFYQKSLKEVLETISFTNNLSYTQKENTVYIDFKDIVKQDH